MGRKDDKRHRDDGNLSDRERDEWAKLNKKWLEDEKERDNREDDEERRTR
jgi:hypothetical protein